MREENRQYWITNPQIYRLLEQRYTDNCLSRNSSQTHQLLFFHGLSA